MNKDILTPEERREQTRAAIIDDILAIAREMMQAEGVAALSFNAIARRLGIKPPSLYTYFDSKAAIYDALFRSGYEQFAGVMRASIDTDAALEDNLISAFTTYMQFAQENPDLYQIMFQRPVPGFVPSEESLAVSFGVLDESRAMLAAVLAQSDLTPGMPVHEAHDIMIALLHGLTELHLANNPELPAGQGRFGSLIHQAVSVLINAWTTPS